MEPKCRKELCAVLQAHPEGSSSWSAGTCERWDLFGQESQCVGLVLDGH